VFVGPVPHGEIPQYIATFDIAVVPHSNEFRSPIKLFEYMAQAKAVVAPQTEPIASVVEDSRTGLLFEPNGEPSLRQCLIRLVDDAEGRRRLGEAARRLLENNYTWEHNAERVWKQVREIAAQSAEAGGPRAARALTERATGPACRIAERKETLD
jgi:glycosyltransferase involved in cell wall biosynthesis